MLGRLLSVNVLVKGTTIGTTTDIDGNYFISVPDKNAVLVFSYIGFESQEVKVGGQININVNMSEESNSLDEVVVVGYGSQKRASVVGSITAIEPAQLQQGTTRAVSNNLAGQLAGVIAVQRNGEPESDSVIITSVSPTPSICPSTCFSLFSIAAAYTFWLSCVLPESRTAAAVSCSAVLSLSDCFGDNGIAMIRISTPVSAIAIQSLFLSCRSLFIQDIQLFFR